MITSPFADLLAHSNYCPSSHIIAFRSYRIRILETPAAGHGLPAICFNFLIVDYQYLFNSHFHNMKLLNSVADLTIPNAGDAWSGTLWRAKNERFPMQVMQEHCDELKINYSQSRWCRNTVTSWKLTIPNQVMQEHCDELKINYSQSGDAGTLWRAEN